MLEDKQLWRIHLFTKDGQDEYNEYRQYCIDKGLLAIGWIVEENKSYENFEEYVKEGKEKGEREDNDVYKTPFIKATNAMRNIKRGDYCWTRGDNGKYYLGIMEDDDIICKKIDDYPDIGCYRKCKWTEFELDDVPGKVISCLIAGSTLQRIDDIGALLYSHFLLTKDKTVISGEDNFFSILHPDDIEDLVGIYLQYEKNYIYVPSTNKKGTAVIEYMLINREKPYKKAVIQCKSGYSSIDEKLFGEDYEEYEIYLFVVDGSVPEIKEKDKNRIIKIEKKKLFDFCVKNKEILPNRIKKYIEMIS